MFELLWLVPILPLAGFLTLVVIGAGLSRRAIASIAVGSVAVSAGIAILIGIAFITSPPPSHVYSQTLWTWLQVGDFVPTVTFHLDALSLVMVLVVAFVGFLIHFYSIEFMIEEEGYSRFFAYMNLFVGSMLILVLADNLLFLLLGWEGVGLCSYLLIGFWYKTPENGRAAIKAFVVTRVGDTAMVIAILLIFKTLGTLNIQRMMELASQEWTPGSSVAVATAALLLVGALGKSAQLPLQTWLPDAMVGPTPVSALIHAATMVTAGMYLIARTHVIFTLAPDIQFLVAILGASTLLLAGCSALTQRKIKSVLAYSTISQIGYMFLALGVGAWSAAVLHFMAHAFFKSLLFLAAGVIITALDHENDMLKMGGLRKRLPLTFWVFLLGALTTAGLPPTVGFVSKDLILYQVWTSPRAGPLLWLAATAGVFFTTAYTFRMLFLVFFGAEKKQPSKKAGAVMGLPMAVLAVLCLAGAVLEWPGILGGAPWFSDFLHSALPGAAGHDAAPTMEVILEVVSVATSLLGLTLAWVLLMVSPAFMTGLLGKLPAAALHRLWFSGWGFDWIYDKLFVKPFLWIAGINKDDFIDGFYDGLAVLAEMFHRLLSLTQTGNLRWYAAGITFGAIIILAFMVFA